MSSSDEEWESPKVQKKEGDWEVVDRSAKKRQKNASRLEKKSLTKKEQEDAAKEEVERKKADAKRFLEQYKNAAGTVNSAYSDDTAYTALLEADEVIVDKKKKKKKEGFDTKEGEVLVFQSDEKKKQPKQQKKQKENKKVENKKRVPFAEALKKITPASVQQQLTTLSDKYKADQEVQLKGLAEYLETQLDQVDVAALSADQLANTDFPLNAFNAEVVKSIKNWLSKMSDPAISSFFWFLTSTLVNIQDGKEHASGLGIRLLIQIVARNHPQALVTNIKKITETHVKGKVIDSNKYPTFSWIFHQFSTQFSSGLTAWFHFMLPYITDAKNTAAHLKDGSLQYIENLYKAKRNTFIDDDTAAAIYDKMLQYKHSGEKLEARLVAHLPNILDPTLLVAPKAVSRKLFHTMLGYANSAKKEVRDDVLPALAKLLATEKGYYNAWAEVYAKQLSQSHELLDYIQANWKSLSKKMSGEELARFVDALSDLNKKTRKQVKKAEYVVIDKIDANVQKLQKQLKSFSKATKAATKQVEEAAGFGASTALIISAIGIASTATAWYIANNCCGIDQCRSLIASYPQLNEFFHCKL